MQIALAWTSHRSTHPDGYRSVEYLLKLLLSDSAVTQDRRLIPSHIDNSRFDPHPAQAAIENEVNLFTKVKPHMLRARGTDTPESIGRWRRNRLAKRP
jgi:hypothetical protein